MTPADQQHERIDQWTGEFTYEGWITEDGRFLPCDREFMHETVAMCAFDHARGALMAENAGWLRISSDSNQIRGTITQAQMNTLWDYCEALEFDYKRMLNSIETV